MRTITRSASGAPTYSNRLVLAAGHARQTCPSPCCDDVRRTWRRTDCTPRAPGRTHRDSAPCRAAPAGPGSSPRARCRRSSSSSIIARMIVLVNHLDLRHFVRGAEAVEEVQERNARFAAWPPARSARSPSPPAPSRAEHRPTRSCAPAITSLWSPKIESACVASVRAVTWKTVGRQFARDLEHVRDHQQQALRRGERAWSASRSAARRAPRRPRRLRSASPRPTGWCPRGSSCLPTPIGRTTRPWARKA